jgi:hypothetical protein
MDDSNVEIIIHGISDMFHCCFELNRIVKEYGIKDGRR